MRGLVLALALVLCPWAQASPKVRADVDANTVTCSVVLDALPATVVTAADTFCDFDIAGLTPGDHQVTMVAMPDPASSDWGPSPASAVLSVSVPDVPAAPGVLQIVAAGGVSVLRSLVVGASACNINMDGVASTVQAVDSLCDYELSDMAPGTHLVTMTALNTDPLWGTLESASSALLTIRKTATPNITVYVAVVTLTCVRGVC